MIVGQSAAYRTLLARLRRFASCSLPVLLEGETGTGKELAAREIHYAGARSGKPFIPVNCGALPDTLIENELFGHVRGAFTDAKSEQPGLVDHAQGGTLFLDEVDALSPKAQVTLLRFLEEKEYRPVGGRIARAADVRVVAASNASLDQLAGEGCFRRDLFYRLNVLYLRLPPLRDRDVDIPLLAQHFLDVAAQQLGAEPKRWTDAALRALCGYAWPGNVRELENIALRAYVGSEGTEVGMAQLAAADPAFPEAAPERAGEIDRDDSFRASRNRAIQSFERLFLTELLRNAGGNVSAAARIADIERRQLGKLLKKHGIAREVFRYPAQDTEPSTTSTAG